MTAGVRQSGFFVKLETTPGTAIALDAASAMHLIEGTGIFRVFTIDPDRPTVRAYVDFDAPKEAQALYGAFEGCRFEVKVPASNTAEWNVSALLQAGGMTVTANAGDVDYDCADDPNTTADGLAAVSVKSEESADGNQYTISGARLSGARFVYSDDGLFLEGDLIGRYTNVADVSAIASPAPATDMPFNRLQDAGADLFGLTDLVLEEFQIELGLDAVPRKSKADQAADFGYRFPFRLVKSRPTTLTTVLEVEDTTRLDIYAMIRDKTLTASNTITAERTVDGTTDTAVFTLRNLAVRQCQIVAGEPLKRRVTSTAHRSSSDNGLSIKTDVV